MTEADVKRVEAMAKQKESLGKSFLGVVNLDAKVFLEECVADALALRALLAERQRLTWQPIETAPHNKTVLVYYTNTLGNGRTVRACFYDVGRLSMDGDAEDQDDNGMNTKAGWCEESEAYEFLIWVDGSPTHWMPLPAPPTERTT